MVSLARFADCRSSNEVTLEDPSLTETGAGGDVRRELFGPAPDIARLSSLSPSHSEGSPLGSNRTPLPRAGSRPAPALGAVARGDDGGGVSSSASRVLRCFRRSWQDGGRTISLLVEGGGVLLSKRGWGAWKRWASSGGEEASSPRGGAAEGCEGEGSAATASSTGGALVSECAHCADLQLSGTYLTVEPFEYESPGDSMGLPAGGQKTQAERLGVRLRRADSVHSSALAVRADVEFTITTALFLRGHWATELRAWQSTTMCVLVSRRSCAYYLNLLWLSLCHGRRTCHCTRRSSKKTLPLQLELCPMESLCACV